MHAQLFNIWKLLQTKESSLFHYGSLCHIETSPLICSASQWTVFYMVIETRRERVNHRTLSSSLREKSKLYFIQKKCKDQAQAICV